MAAKQNPVWMEYLFIAVGVAVGILDLSIGPPLSGLAMFAAFAGQGALRLYRLRTGTMTPVPTAYQLLLMFACLALLFLGWHTGR